MKAVLLAIAAMLFAPTSTQAFGCRWHGTTPKIQYGASLPQELRGITIYATFTGSPLQEGSGGIAAFPGTSPTPPSAWSLTEDLKCHTPQDSPTREGAVTLRFVRAGRLGGPHTVGECTLKYRCANDGTVSPE